MICKDCELDLPEESFYTNDSRKRWSYKFNSCKSCHYERSRQRKIQLRLENIIKLMIYFQTHPCIGCGETDPVILDADHRDPSTKTKSVSYYLKNNSWRWVLQELEKCDIRLC